jgi:hypothetical protein
MSGTENQPDKPASDAPDNARKAQRPPSLGAELAGSQRAEPMSREDYANFMRQEPAADTGEDAGDTESRPAQTGFSSNQLQASDLGDGQGQDELSTDQSSEDQLADSDNPTPGSAEAHEPTETSSAPEPDSEMAAKDGTDPPGPPDAEPDGDQPDEVQRQFLEKLAGLEQRLRQEEIPYALFGSLAASAYIDGGAHSTFIGIMPTTRPSAFRTSTYSCRGTASIGSSHISKKPGTVTSRSR